MRSLYITDYVAEPGPNALYYANISSSMWHLSERPFLVVITPAEVGDDANITILTPKFELSRAMELKIPNRGNSSLMYIPWEEHENPYLVWAQKRRPTHEGMFLLPDEGTRNFVVNGLTPVSNVKSDPYDEVKSIRERKSERELKIMRCANEVCSFSVEPRSSERQGGFFKAKNTEDCITLDRPRF